MTPLMVLTDRRLAAGAGRSLLDVVAAAVDGGARTVLLREKDLPRAERARLAEDLVGRLAPVAGSLLVASDAGLAREVGAAGVHLAAADPPLPGPGVAADRSRPSAGRREIAPTAAPDAVARGRQRGRIGPAAAPGAAGAGRDEHGPGGSRLSAGRRGIARAAAPDAVGGGRRRGRIGPAAAPGAVGAGRDEHGPGGELRDGGPGATAPAAEAPAASPVVGRSCHTVEELRAAQAEGCDYVTYSPVWLTESKPGYGPALGSGGLAAGCAAVPDLLVYALGGIEPGRGRVAGCLAAGASGVAVMGAIMRADDPTKVVAALLEELP